jgi:hypothetical protein
VNCRIVLHVAHYPERFRIMPPLSSLIAMKEGSRSDAMSAVWKLVKVAGAQDKEDGTIIRPVGGLEKVSLETSYCPDISDHAGRSGGCRLPSTPGACHPFPDPP